mgnify:FL=1
MGWSKGCAVSAKQQAAKLEVIRLVAGSPVSVTQKLKEVGINHSTVYKWYARYVGDGYARLANRYQPPRRFWNKIPSWKRERLVK